MHGTFTALTLVLGMIGWGIFAWTIVGFLALIPYHVLLGKLDGCWTHSSATEKDKIADWIGYHAEMGEWFRLLLAAPILVPIGLVTLRRNGLYGERRHQPVVS
ncbi:MAG: hypothetical protein Q8R16_01900 [bacterium]|nr:hypothetical protein [bacterium]